MQRRRMNFYCPEISRKIPDKNPNFGNVVLLKQEHLSKNYRQFAFLVIAFNKSLGVLLGDFSGDESDPNRLF